MTVFELETEEFGRLGYTDDDVFEFPEGLPGFEAETRFLRYQPQALAPIEVLLSLSNPGLRFYTVPLPFVSADYQLALGDEQRELLGLAPAGQPTDCLVLITWPENGDPTVNLLAPVVLNRATHRGLQAIQFDSHLSPRFPLRARGAMCS